VPRIELIAHGRVHVMTLRREVAEGQKAEISQALKGTVWQSGCQSWYLDANGEALSWPWSMQRFRQELRAPILTEYHVA
jgi:methionine salvage enolase-phosphatase E1